MRTPSVNGGGALNFISSPIFSYKPQTSQNSIYVGKLFIPFFFFLYEIFGDVYYGVILNVVFWEQFGAVLTFILYKECLDFDVRHTNSAWRIGNSIDIWDILLMVQIFLRFVFCLVSRNSQSVYLIFKKLLLIIVFFFNIYWAVYGLWRKPQESCKGGLWQFQPIPSDVLRKGYCWFGELNWMIPYRISDWSRFEDSTSGIFLSKSKIGAFFLRLWRKELFFWLVNYCVH